MSVKRSRTPLSQGVLSLNDHSTDSSRQSPFPSSPMLTDPQASPRQTTPTKSYAVSRPEYSSELSLSDVDTEVKKFQRSRRFSPVVHEVLYTEVGDEGNDFNKGGAVSTKTTKINSPARVICHSPSSHRDGSVLRQEKLKAKKEGRSTPAGTKQKTAKSLSFDQESMMNTSAKLNGSSNKQIQSTDAPNKELVGSDAKKKKKKFLVVESRFKQSSKKDETLKSKSLELSAITPHPNHHSTNQNSNKKSRVTSTPFLMTSMYEGQLGGGVDGSLLDQTRFQTTNTEPPIKAPLVKKNKVLRKEKSSGSALQRKENTKQKDHSRENHKDNYKGTMESEQLVLDLHHTRRLQQLYLNMKSRQTFDKQEEKAKDEMYALWALNRRIEKEIEALTLAVKTRKMEIAIDQLLNVQIDGIKPLSGKLSKLIIKSNRFAQALSNTSHYLNVNNVAIGNESDLLRALDESKSLLAGITSLTRRHQPQVEELSTCSEVLMKTAKGEIRQQAQCCELLGACSSLTNQELSLQAQVLQAS